MNFTRFWFNNAVMSRLNGKKIFEKILINFFVLLFFIFGFLCLNVLNSKNILALETIQINKGHRNPIPIALNTSKTLNSDARKLADDILEIIQNDLEYSGLFNVISQDKFIDSNQGIEHIPNFQAWKILNTNVLVNSEVSFLNRNTAVIKFVLYDVITGKEIAYKNFDASIKNVRKLAHLVSNFIYEKITGEKGYFNSKIAYTAVNYSKGKKITRIAVMDYDGHNHKYITNGKYLTITPRFSSDGTHIAYVSYVHKIPKVYIKNIHTGEEKLATNLVNFPKNMAKAMSSSPRFSSDNKKMLITISKDGASNIFELNFYNKTYSQITNNQRINTSGVYSYDSESIFYNSDVGGGANIYNADKRGFDIKKIGQIGNYFTPIQSPNGEYVAATKIDSDQFSIVIMNSDGSGERKITEGFLVESPSFAPNSNLIAFTREEKARINDTSKKNLGKMVNASYIYVVDVTGNYMRKLNTPGFGMDPDWSNDLSDKDNFWSR